MEPCCDEVISRLKLASPGLIATEDARILSGLLASSLLRRLAEEEM